MRSYEDEGSNIPLATVGRRKIDGKDEKMTHSFDMLSQTLHVKSSITSIPDRSIPRPHERTGNGIRSRDISPNHSPRPVQMTMDLTSHARNIRARHRPRAVLAKEIIQERFFGGGCRRGRRRNPFPVVAPGTVMVVVVRVRRRRIPCRLRVMSSGDSGRRPSVD